MNRCGEIERSIITTYRKTIWSRFVRAVKEYALVSEGDRIAACRRTAPSSKRTRAFWNFRCISSKRRSSTR